MTGETFESAQGLTPSGALANLNWKVRNETLLYFLGLAPLSVLIVLGDMMFAGGRLKVFMDHHLMEIISITAALTFPHIIASLVSFVDPEYRKYYRVPLRRGVMVSLGLALGSDILFGGYALLVTVAFYSIYHNIMQQFGISAIMLRQKPGFLYNTMKWLLVLPSWMAYSIISFPIFPQIARYERPLIVLVGVCLALGTLLAAYIFARIPDKKAIPDIGIRYFTSNIAILLLSFAMVVAGYGPMAVLLGRLLHDITAYWIYMVHDQNRNETQTNNPVYALPRKMGIMPLYALVPIAVAISAIVLSLEASHLEIVAIIISSFNMMHYHVESYTWKYGTLHRRYVPFT